MDDRQEQRLGRLVEAFSDDPGSHPLRDQLAEELRPVVEPLAAEIARRMALPDATSFVGESVWHLLEPRPLAPLPRVCMWHPDEGRFDGWARTTLTRMAIDGLRDRARRAHHPLGDGDHAVREEVIERRSREARLTNLYDTPFPPRDIQRMADWGPDHRLELTLISGLWVKFCHTPKLWETVRQDYEIAREIVLPSLFPPVAFLVADELRERVAAVAPALGYFGPQGRNSLRKRWERYHPRLRILDCMGEFRPTEPEP